MCGLSQRVIMDLRKLGSLIMLTVDNLMTYQTKKTITLLMRSTIPEASINQAGADYEKQNIAFHLLDCIYPATFFSFLLERKRNKTISDSSVFLRRMAPFIVTNKSLRVCTVRTPAKQQYCHPCLLPSLPLALPTLPFFS